MKFIRKLYDNYNVLQSSIIHNSYSIFHIQKYSQRDEDPNRRRLVLLYPANLKCISLWNAIIGMSFKNIWSKKWNQSTLHHRSLIIEILLNSNLSSTRWLVDAGMSEGLPRSKFQGLGGGTPPTFIGQLTSPYDLFIFESGGSAP